MLISQIQRFPLLLLKIVPDIYIYIYIYIYAKSANIFQQKQNKKTIDNLVFRFQKVTS